MSAPTNRTFSKKIGAALTEILAIAFWIYTLVNVFIYNSDSAIGSRIDPEFAGLLRFKLLVLFVCLSTSLIAIGRSRTIGLILYIIFYPVILITYRVPAYIWRRKSWVLAFSFLNSMVGAILAFQKTTLVVTLYAVGLTMTLVAQDQATVLGAALMVLLSTLFCYYDAFASVFRTTEVFRLYHRAVEYIRDKAEDQFAINEELRGPVDALDSNQLAQRTQLLSNAVLFNRAYLFVARRLKSTLPITKSQTVQSGAAGR